MNRRSKGARYRRGAAIIALNGVLAVYSIFVAEFVRSSSTSVVTNMYLILGWVALVGIVSYLEAAVIRDLVARGGWRGKLEIRDPHHEAPRPWRDLHLPLTIAILALFGLNMLVFDVISRGFFIEGQRATYTITRMRSDDEVLQREGIVTAARMKDPGVRRALVERLEHEGSTKALATWALGKVGTPREADALIKVLRAGAPAERAASAVALGRLNDSRLTIELADRLRRPGEPLESYLYGLGLLGDPQAVGPVVELMLDESTAPDHLALAAWVLGELDDDRACPTLLDVIGPMANPLTCAAMSSIRRLRCDGSSERLIGVFEGSNLEDRCESQRFVDVDGQAYELWQGGLFRVKVLETIIRCARPETRSWLRALSRDGTQVPQIRHLAKQAVTARPPSKRPSGSRE